MDEDGVDVVEAIDAWIDEEIDELTDDELEAILEILDVVSASPLATVDADDVYDDDIAELVELAGGSADDRAYTSSILRAALFGEALDQYDDGSDEPDLSEPDDESDLSEPDDEPDDEDEDNDEDEPDDEDEDNDEDEPDDEDEDDDEPDEPDDEADLSEPDHEDADAEPATGDGHDDFLNDLADAERHDLERYENVTETRELIPALAPAMVRPVELRDYDELGPSFLSETSTSPRPRRAAGRRIGKILLPTFMIVGLAAFAFGMVQLINSLNEDEAAVDVATESPTSETPSATAAPESSPTPTEAPTATAPLDPSAPTPVPTPEPTPAPRLGIRLVTGDVMLASFPTPGEPAEISQIYDVTDDDLSPARQVIWLTEGLGIVDADGNVLVVDPDDRRPEPTIIYEAGGGFGEATKIASVRGQVAILTEAGNISLTPSNGRADPDVIQLVWDAAEEGASATDLAAVDGLVPFVLDNGNAQMIVTDNDNVVVPIWVAEDQPAAFNVGGSTSGILLGVGQGAVARYNVDPDADAVLESVWDPFAREDEPAIGYSSAGDGTAIVTGNGAIVLADGDGGGPIVWDPNDTEIRAFVALGSETQVVVLLETGSIVRIPLDPDQFIESIWDITDETLSPANQVSVEPVAPASGDDG